MYTYLLEMESGSNRTIEIEKEFSPFSTIWLCVDGDEWINTRFVKRIEFLSKFVMEDDLDGE